MLVVSIVLPLPTALSSSALPPFLQICRVFLTVESHIYTYCVPYDPVSLLLLNYRYLYLRLS